jgi:hypothetical protein
MNRADPRQLRSGHLFCYEPLGIVGRDDFAPTRGPVLVAERSGTRLQQAKQLLIAKREAVLAELMIPDLALP